MGKNSGGTSRAVVASDGSLRVLEERVGWIQKVGWVIVGLFMAGFTIFVGSYLPKEFASSRLQAKNDINDAVGPIREDIARLTERLSKQAAFNLQSLIPSVELARTLDPAVLKARFQEADSLINTAIAEHITATPALLQNTQAKLRDTVQLANLPSDVRSFAIASLVHFEAYNVFSSAVIAVNVPKILVSQDGTNYAPVTIAKPVWLEGTGKEGATITVDFTGTHPPFPHAGAFVILGGDAVLSKMRAKGKDNSAAFLIITSDRPRVLVNETRIENLTQQLGGVTWVNVDFVNSIIRYTGEPTFLGNVTFTNCKFELGTDSGSKWLLARISGPAMPVTLASTARY